MSFEWGLALGKMYIGYVAYSIYSSLLPVARLAMKHAFLVVLGKFGEKYPWRA